MPSPVLVKLSKAMFSLTAFYAKQLQESQERLKAQNAKVLDKEDLFIHLIGALGQVAVSEYLGLPVEIDLSDVTDGGVDIHFKDKTIEVKTSWHNTDRSRLLLKTLKKLTTDYVVLATIDPDKPRRAYIRGFITKEDFIKRHKVINLGYRDNVAVTQEDLSPIEDLKKLIVGEPEHVKN